MTTIEITINNTEYTLTDNYNSADIAAITESDLVYVLEGTESDLDLAEDIIKEQPDAVMIWTDNSTCLVFSNYEIEEADLKIIQFDYEIDWNAVERKSGKIGVYGE